MSIPFLVANWKSQVTPTTVKPSANTLTGSPAWTNPGYAYDVASGNDLSTNATSTITGTTSFASTMVVRTVSALTSQPYSSKKLYINWSIDTYTDPNGDNPTFAISISKNSGTLFTNYAGADGPIGVSAVASGQIVYELGSSQDETLVQVKAAISLVSAGPITETIKASIWDCWIVGT